MGVKLLGRLVSGVKGGIPPLLGRLVKTKSFYGHGLPYEPREILKRLGVEGRVLIVGCSVVASNSWQSGWVKYIKLWP